MEHHELLQHYRDQVDTIDLEIVYLLSRRFWISKEIWKIKKETDMPILQEERWDSLLTMLFEEADERWLERDFILDLWEKIHKESMRIQK